MRVVPAGRGQGIVVISRISHLLADVDVVSIDCGNRRAVNQTVDEGSVGILENLLDGAGKLVGRLRPVMIFHGDNKNLLDLPVVTILCAGAPLASQGQ
jgi:hypothetical protein